jgi:hypothetical protein
MEARPGFAARKASGKGIVSACIEDHDIHGVLCHIHLGEHDTCIHCLVVHLGLAFDVRVNWDQVVLAVHLHAVAGVEEQAHSAFLDAFAEGLDGLLHLGLIQVGSFGHGEPEVAQGLRHGLCVIRGILERRRDIRAVPDHERNFALFAGNRRGLSLDLHAALESKGCGSAQDKNKRRDQYEYLFHRALLTFRSLFSRHPQRTPRLSEGRVFFVFLGNLDSPGLYADVLYFCLYFEHAAARRGAELTEGRVSSKLTTIRSPTVNL